MEFTAQQIAGLLDGEIVGNPEIIVNKLSKIEEGDTHSLSFLANLAYEQYLYTTDASIVIINKDLVLEKEVKSTCTLIRVEDAYQCFAKLLETYDQFKKNKSGIDKQTAIADNATLGENVYVGAFSYIGENVTIGNDVKIYPNSYIGDNTTIGDNTIINAGVKIYHDCVIGKNCTFHSGTIIGADGFGFAPNSENEYNKVPQIGNVIIEDYVEIGANSCVDRATLGSTVIKKGVKIDNLVQIAHNVVVGEHSVIVSQVGIAGSTKIGKNCMIAGQVGIIGHLKIGNGVKIAAQSGITRDIEDNGIVQGSPAYAVRDYTKSYAVFKNLPSLNNRLNDLEKKLK
ncbi:MAG: UDP-3-O-(3-hydroxymyristoyl)glucosamine N-acyltransferase [Vicingus serpentipes]|nr:UDP-3-O-(3-hydroxymyristoyl)glucosamine N-acyltransferase [Vicingus serpentipes]